MQNAQIMFTCYGNRPLRRFECFCQEARSADAPALLLLHGLAISSSRIFRELIPVLADHYLEVAPELPGFGSTDAPDRTHFT
jgi:pimeloyl-ACP methyl ester carboxylesterase